MTDLFNSISRKQTYTDTLKIERLAFISKFPGDGRKLTPKIWPAGTRVNGAEYLR